MASDAYYAYFPSSLLTTLQAPSLRDSPSQCLFIIIMARRSSLARNVLLLVVVSAAFVACLTTGADAAEEPPEKGIYISILDLGGKLIKYPVKATESIISALFPDQTDAAAQDAAKLLKGMVQGGHEGVEVRTGS
jgi:hypothetical protein